MTAVVGPRPRSRRKAVGAATVLGLVVIAVGLLLSGSPPPRPLDPTSTAPDGTRALARVLADTSQVRLETARDLATLQRARADAGTTIVVTDADALSVAAADALANSSAGRVVLLTPDDTALRRMRLPLEQGTAAGLDGDLTGSCPGATDGDVDRDDRLIAPDAILYRATDTGAHSCLTPSGDDGDGDASEPTGASTEAGGAYARVPAQAGRPETIVFGAPETWTNERITEQDDSAAAIAVRALGRHERLVWYLPSPEQDGPPLAAGPAVVPPWFAPGVALLGIAVVTLCLWRGRRFGSLAAEPLAVAVPAVETTHARARLYARSGDATHALTLMQRGAIDRLRQRLGLAPGTPDAVVVDRVVAVLGAAEGGAEAARRTLTDPTVTPARLAARVRELRRIEREVDTA